MKEKKIIFLFLTVVLLLPNFYYVSAQGVPVNDYPAQVTQKVHLKEKITQDIWEQLKRAWENYVKPALRDAASKKLMDLVTQQTLDWINNGKKPTFVSDYKAFTKEATNIAFSSLTGYLQQDGVNLCAPFAPQLQLQLNGMKNYYSGRYSNLPTGCNYDQFKQNIENGVDFISQGDWVSYDAMFSPDVNPGWLSIRVKDEFMRKQAEEKEAKINEAVASSGFLGSKKCIDYGNYGSPDDVATMCAEDSHKGDDICSNNSAKNTACAKWEIETPGDVAAKAVDNMIKSDSLWAAGIHNFVSVVINALISKVFQKGLSALSKDSVNYDRDVVNGTSTMTTIDFESNRKKISETYKDIIYFFDSPNANPSSNDYPVIDIYAQTKGVTLQGKTDCVANKTDWEKKYDELDIVVAGLTQMINEAKTNLAEIEALKSDDLNISQKMAEAGSKLTDFNSNYGSFIGETTQAKESGDMTDTQKLGQNEYLYLQSAFTPPSCLSPYQPAS